MTSKRVALKHIKSCYKTLKEKNSALSITHVLDREFDDSEYFDFIHQIDTPGKPGVLRQQSCQLLQIELDSQIKLNLT